MALSEEALDELNSKYGKFLLLPFFLIYYLLGLAGVYFFLSLAMWLWLITLSFAFRFYENGIPFFHYLLYLIPLGVIFVFKQLGIDFHKDAISLAFMFFGLSFWTFIAGIDGKKTVIYTYIFFAIIGALTYSLGGSSTTNPHVEWDGHGAYVDE